MSVKICFIITLLFLACINDIIAKAPGYLGKRYEIGYNHSSSPSFKHYNTYNQKIGFNHFYELRLNYITGRFTSIGLSYEFTNSSITPTINNNSQILFAHETGIKTFGEEFFYASLMYYEQSINIQHLRLNFRYYTGKTIAPIGNYIELSPFLGIYTFKEELKVYHAAYFYKIEDDYSPLFTLNGTVKSPFANDRYLDAGGKLSIGHQRVFFDKITLEMGMRSSLTIRQLQSFNKVEDNVFDDLENELFNRTFNHSNFMLYLGIGVLGI